MGRKRKTQLGKEQSETNDHGKLLLVVRLCQEDEEKGLVCVQPLLGTDR